MLSLLLPDGGIAAETTASFCSFVHYFASPAAAYEYTARHPGTFAVSVGEGFEVGRRARTRANGASRSTAALATSAG